MHSEDGDLWEAFAHYNTNADGTVNCESHWVLYDSNFTDKFECLFKCQKSNKTVTDKREWTSKY